ncbi:Dehydrogenase/reductase SDR family member 7 [Lamellibrachia satsuma]|nr:Dehydrogenase/reductase SDR family member 7 [Lamellibrachia satsuma]
MLELNVLGPISLTTAVLPQMVKQKRGQLVVIGSLASKIGLPMSSTYCASKAAVNLWFESVCIEHSDDHIDVTLVHPGPVFSDLSRTAFTEEPGRMYNKPAIPVEDRMTAERCAELTAVAIANRESEVWVAQQPYLLIFYLAQYVSNISRWPYKLVEKKLLH